MRIRRFFAFGSPLPALALRVSGVAVKKQVWIPHGMGEVDVVTNASFSCDADRRRAHWTHILGVAAVLTALMLACSQAAQGAETLVSTSKPIFSFAQDGPFVAWTAGGGRFTCPRPSIEYLPT